MSNHSSSGHLIVPYENTKKPLVQRIGNVIFITSSANFNIPCENTKKPFVQRTGNIIFVTGSANLIFPRVNTKKSLVRRTPTFFTKTPESHLSSGHLVVPHGNTKNTICPADTYVLYDNTKKPPVQRTGNITFKTADRQYHLCLKFSELHLFLTITPESLSSR